MGFTSLDQRPTSVCGLKVGLVLVGKPSIPSCVCLQSGRVECLVAGPRSPAAAGASPVAGWSDVLAFVASNSEDLCVVRASGKIACDGFSVPARPAVSAPFNLRGLTNNNALFGCQVRAGLPPLCNVPT